MLAGDVPAAMKLREEAQELAVKLNGVKSLGICGGSDAPASALERETAAPAGAVPMWGQVAAIAIHFLTAKSRVSRSQPRSSSIPCSAKIGTNVANRFSACAEVILCTLFRGFGLVQRAFRFVERIRSKARLPGSGSPVTRYARTPP
jgi:hypothetical protein